MYKLKYVYKQLHHFLISDTDLKEKDEYPYAIEDIIEEPELNIKSVDVEEHKEEIGEEIPQARVFYNGSQLWKTYFDSPDKTRVLAKLREENRLKIIFETLCITEEKQYRWGGQGSSKNPCAETYGGSGAFSEPETASIQRFIKGMPANWKAYVSFHSYGQYILYPWGYSRVVPPDFKDLDGVGKKAAAAIRSVGGPAYTVGAAANTLYPAAGGSDDWAKGTIHMKYGFVLPASYINPTAQEALAALRVIAEAAAAA
ncbi:hypothetical protein NQ317_000227 [Molorchus minor]|uniref:Peptidase M14 domain-containing protein n=1 Tax=Molorchus minor TaxID=1323400 RepID=A0ABQ9JTC3_9CUCU|nr:hypothetical protein NQ317_000227 [Molorchus minor]